jgi:hypothetical protein
LDQGKLAKIFNFLEDQGIGNGNEIKKTDKIIEMIGHGDEEIFLFRNLEEEGNGEEKGEDDDTTHHQSLYVFQYSLMGIKRVN